jgi:TP901 family phage tail tape measure protein
VGVGETAKLIASLELKDKFSPGMKSATASLGKFEKGLGKASSGAGQLAGGLTKAGTRIAAGVALGLTGAAKAAIDWQEAFTGVQKTVDASSLAKGTTFRDLELVLRQMATEMPNTADELAAIAEAGGALGIAGKDIAAFTRQVAILASTTNVSADDAATALGQLQNVIGLTGEEFDNFAASLVDLGNKGASTEAAILEIARRAGGAAKLFGIAKDETLGWAAAAANLGLNEELAGTALQNVFVKLMPAYIQGSKNLVRITGKTAAQLKKSFKTDAGGAIESLIEQLGKMPKDQRLKAVQDLFGKSSGLTRLVLGLADSYKNNLAPSLDTATKSWEEATAAQIEFDKRNATVSSALKRLGNGINDAAISIGEGFTPAVGRAADKLAKFLALPANRGELQKLGKQIGDEIDKIDWDKVIEGAKDLVDVMKTALSFAKLLFDAFNRLPTEVKGAAAAIVALDKLSGGLVIGGAGNIVGGLGETLAKSLAARIPIFGKAFVQPVFVTNLGAGGLGGVPGAAAGAGGAASAAGGIGAGAVAAGAIGAAVIVALQEGSKEAAKAFNKEFSKVGIGANFQGAQFGPQGILPALENIAEVIRVAGQLQNAGLHETEAASFTQSQKQTTAAEKTRQRFTEEMTGFKSAHKDSATKQTNAIEKVRGRISDVITNNTSQETKTQTATRNAGSIAASASRAAGDAAATAARAGGQAAKAGGLAAAAAIRAKKMSFNTTVNVSTRVSVRDNIASENTVSKYGHKVL